MGKHVWEMNPTFKTADKCKRTYLVCRRAYPQLTGALCRATAGYFLESFNQKGGAGFPDEAYVLCPTTDDVFRMEWAQLPEGSDAFHRWMRGRLRSNFRFAARWEYTLTFFQRALLMLPKESAGDRTVQGLLDAALEKELALYALRDRLEELGDSASAALFLD